MDLTKGIIKLFDELFGSKIDADFSSSYWLCFSPISLCLVVSTLRSLVFGFCFSENQSYVAWCYGETKWNINLWLLRKKSLLIIRDLKIFHWQYKYIICPIILTPFTFYTRKSIYFIITPVDWLPIQFIDFYYLKFSETVGLLVNNFIPWQNWQSFFWINYDYGLQHFNIPRGLNPEYTYGKSINVVFGLSKDWKCH